MGNQVPTKPTASTEPSSPRTGTFYLNVGDLLIGSMIMNEKAYFGPKARVSAEEQAEWDEIYQEFNKGNKEALIAYLNSPHLRINWVPEDGQPTSAKVTAADVNASL